MGSGLSSMQMELLSESNVKEITAKFRELKYHAMPFIWILITWKGLDVLHGTRNIFLIQEWLQN
jgi:hypothetical protein